MRGHKTLPLGGAHFVQPLQRLGFARRIFVKHQDDVLAIGPLLDFSANNFGQMHGGDVFDWVVLVDHHGGVVGETRREACEKKRESVDRGADSHNTDLESPGWIE